MNKFDSSEFLYLYNCAGDYVAEEQGKKIAFNTKKASQLADLAASLKGAEYAVVIHNGILGVMAEQRFTDPAIGKAIKGRIIERMHPFFSKYNGSGNIRIGIMEEGLKAIWPQLFIPSDTCLMNKNLLNHVSNEFSEVLININ